MLKCSHHRRSSSRATSKPLAKTGACRRMKRVTLSLLYRKSHELKRPTTKSLPVFPDSVTFFFVMRLLVFNHGDFMITPSRLQFFFMTLLILGPSCSRTSEHKNNPLSPIVHNSVLPPGWYVQDKDELNNQLEDYLKTAQKNFNVTTDPNSIRVIISPHAGYFYSGLCAATAYQSLLQKRDNLSYDERKNTNITRVIVLAPSHQVFFTHVSLPDFTVYRTVLGDIPVDLEAIKKLGQKKNTFKVFRDVYMKEHALEIQLPFLQKTVANFQLVPLIVGNIKPYDIYDIAAELKDIIDDHTLLVISSDFVHHGQNYDYQIFNDHILDQVRLVDSLVIRAISSQSRQIFDEAIKQSQATVCGREAIRILLALMEVQVYNDLEPKLTCYYTSPQLEKARPGTSEDIKIAKLLEDIPDTEAQNSVSYVSMVFTSQKDAAIPLIDRLTEYEKKSLLRLARKTIENEFLLEDKRKENHHLFPVTSAGLESSAGAFVTLNKKRGELRGCIGRIITQDPLFVTVQQMAKAAAFQDNRFPPLTANELDDIVIDISILEPPVKVASYKDIVIGKHGVILTKGSASAVFLPQVARDEKWSVETTLEHLSVKAGLDKDAWKEGAEFQVFEGCEIQEKH